MKIFFVFVVLFICFFGIVSGHGAESNNYGNINSQVVREDYYAFSKQLKRLNRNKKVTKERGALHREISPELHVSLKENENEMTVSVDMPGVRRDSIEIAIQNGKKLIISAKKKIDEEIKTIEKSIELPSAAKPKSTKVTYEDGVLTLKIEKISSAEVLIPVK
jgi:HSP20 family molecular chaperone IbpA